MADAFALGIAASAANLLAGFGRGKIASVFLGPAGLGAASEVNQVVALFFVPATILTGPALVAAVAKAHDGGDHERLATAYQTIRIGLGVSGLVALLLMAAAAPWLVHLDRNTAIALLALAGLGMFVKSFHAANRQVLVAAGALRHATVLSLVTSMVLFASAWAGTASFHLAGYVGAVLAAMVVAFPLSSWMTGQVLPSLQHSRALLFDRELFAESIRIGGAVLFNQITEQGMLLVLRWRLIETGGLELNGLFHAAWAVGNIHLDTLLLSLGQFVFPRYAKAKSTAELTREVQNATTFMLRMAPPVILAALALRDVGLTLLFTREFLGAGPAVSLILVGAFSKAVTWNQTGPLLYRGHVAAAILVRSVMVVTFLGLSLLLLEPVGLEGVGIAYAYAHFQSMWVSAFVLQHVEGVRVRWSQNATATAWLFGGLVSMWLTEQGPGGQVTVLVFAVVVAWRSGLANWALAKVRRRISRDSE